MRFVNQYAKATSLFSIAGAANPGEQFVCCGSATSQEQVALQQTTPTGQTAPTAAAQFLGSDASLLQSGAEGQAAWVYISPNVQWSNYKTGHAEAGGVLGQPRVWGVAG